MIWPPQDTDLFPIKGCLPCCEEMLWADVAAYEARAFGITTDGALYGWGSNETTLSQLGIGSTTYALVKRPIRLGKDNDWAALAKGDRGRFAIKADGTLWTWGRTAPYSGIGTSTLDVAPVPVQVGADTDWAMVSAGGAHTLALKTDGTLWGWGDNGNGNLGLPFPPASYTTPQELSAEPWLDVAASQNAIGSWAIKADGTLWRCNTTGAAWIQEGTATHWRALAISQEFGWFLTTGGELWRTANTGPFGSMQVVRWGTDDDWAALAALEDVNPPGELTGQGGDALLAIKTDGTLWGWGENRYGQLGLGYLSQELGAVKQVGARTDWTQVSGGDGYAIARRTDGTLWTWGTNYLGQLGQGHIALRMQPGLVM